MRSIILLISLFFVFQIGYSQLFTKKKVLNNENFDKPKLSWGYFLGMNNYDYNFDYNYDLSDIQTQKMLGFNVGLIGNFRISDYFDLRFEPGLVISNRKLIFDPIAFDSPGYMPLRAKSFNCISLLKNANP